MGDIKLELISFLFFTLTTSRAEIFFIVLLHVQAHQLFVYVNPTLAHAQN